MIYNFAFIITDGTVFIDGYGKETTDKKRAERYPYQCEAQRAAATFGKQYRVREID
jgi:hypothetical protein